MQGRLGGLASKTRHPVLQALIALMAAGVAAAPVTTGHDEATGLSFWEWNADGVVFRLTQRLPDQTRAFFLARGFNRASADHFATPCIFQSMLKSAGAAGSGPVAFDLRNWRVHPDGETWPLLIRSDWASSSYHLHRLSDYRGKVILVNFWATWCPPCQEEGHPAVLAVKHIPFHRAGALPTVPRTLL